MGGEGGRRKGYWHESRRVRRRILGDTEENRGAFAWGEFHSVTACLALQEYANNREQRTPSSVSRGPPRVERRKHREFFQNLRSNVEETIALEIVRSKL